MLKALKFVQGAVASKGFAPELTHFRIENGVIRGFNGSLALASPINLDLNVTPKAIPFIKAIIVCKDATAMHITGAGRLGIKSGGFKAYIECIEEIYPDIQPEGEKIPITGDFLEALKVVAPFMAEDASKPWARGALLDGQTVTATNNIVIVQRWLEQPFPLRINVPAKAVKELIRIKESPTHISMTENSASFYYDDGRWLRTNLIDLPWPDINKVLDRDANPEPLPEGFFAAIEDIKPFVDEVGRVIIGEGLITTTREPGVGASVEFPMLTEIAIFNNVHLARIEQIVESIDMTMWPAPCIFYGDNLRGAIIGMKEI